ncbi:MAG: hypothetical protein M1826_004199 [Phylliscum demangeonii]|nr:MAG: hypothetical protein M1826_004199 [Phylliscum demangeonii]
MDPLYHRHFLGAGRFTDENELDISGPAFYAHTAIIARHVPRAPLAAVSQDVSNRGRERATSHKDAVAPPPGVLADITPRPTIDTAATNKRVGKPRALSQPAPLERARPATESLTALHEPGSQAVVRARAATVGATLPTLTSESDDTPWPVAPITVEPTPQPSTDATAADGIEGINEEMDAAIAEEVQRTNEEMLAAIAGPMAELDHDGAMAAAMAAAERMNARYDDAANAAQVQVMHVHRFLRVQLQAPAGHAAGLPQLSEHEVVDENENGFATGASWLGAQPTGAGTVVMYPPLGDGVAKELHQARNFVSIFNPYSPEKPDPDEFDVGMVTPYTDEILAYLRVLERKMLPDPHYMSVQRELQWEMRSIMMDWLVQSHKRFELLPETLFLTANIIDRFLSQKMVSLGKLQLAGATALFIACKYEEIHVPSLEEIVLMADGAYTAEEILRAERFMLSLLQFELGWPGPLTFLRRISKADEYDVQTRTLAKYFLEVALMDHQFLSCPSSFLAAGAHCLARLMLQKGQWTFRFVHYSGYAYCQLHLLMRTLLDCCQDPEKHHLAVFKKYCDRDYAYMAKYVEEQVWQDFQVPDFSPLIIPEHHVADFARPLYRDAEEGWEIDDESTDDEKESRFR